MGFPYEGGDVGYGDLEAGEASSCRPVDRAYRHAAVSVGVAGETLQLTPDDSVGETALSGGRYTYRLVVVDGSLTLELEDTGK